MPIMPRPFSLRAAFRVHRNRKRKKMRLRNLAEVSTSQLGNQIAPSQISIEGCASQINILPGKQTSWAGFVARQTLGEADWHP